MTPRPSGAYQLEHRRIIDWLLLAIGIAAVLIGLAVAIVEFAHGLINRHPPIWQNLVAAGVFLIGGAGIIQTGSVRETLGLIRAAIPLFQSQQPGGQRRTDPPIDDDFEDSIELPPKGGKDRGR